MGQLREIWERRELLLILVSRNLTIRYKNSALGFFWSLLGPLFLIVTYWIFLDILKVPIDIKSLVTGILVWQFLGTCVGDSLYAILGNANLVTKTAFPRVVLPLATVTANLVNFLLSLIVLLVFLAIVGAPFGAVYYLPGILATHFALCLGVSLILCSTNVFFRDVEHVVNVVLLAWFFLSPVIYNNTFVTERFGSMVQALYFANPMAGIVTAYRNVFLSTDVLPGSMMIAPFVLAWSVLALGWFVFHHLEPRFGDEL